MEKYLVALIAILGGIVGAILNNLWSRNSAKKAPKTQMRAEAYKDFVMHILLIAGERPVLSTDSELREILARLMVFGESKVVSAVDRFLSKREELNSDAFRKSFCEVVCAMRTSLVTRSDENVSENIGALFSLSFIRKG
jgi:hypothetical protein